METLSHGRKVLGWGIAQGFRWAGVRAAALRRYDRPGALLSLCAHDPSAAVLRALIRWLKARGFRFVSEQAVLAGAQLPGRTAWLSFDDAWLGFRTQALPVLEAEDVPATLFVAPGESRRGFLWSNALMPCCSMKAIRAWYTRPAEARIQAVAAQVGTPPPKMLLAPEAIQALAAHPLITLGNHSLTHLSCSHRPLSEVVAEVQAAQAELTAWAGAAPRLFCYPFGHRTPETDAVIRALGLRPIGLRPGVDTVETFGTFRNMIYDSASLAENACRVLKAWLPIRRT